MPLPGPLPAAGAQRLGRGLSRPRRSRPRSPWILLSQGFGVMFCWLLFRFRPPSPPLILYFLFHSLKFSLLQSVRQIFKDAL